MAPRSSQTGSAMSAAPKAEFHRGAATNKAPQRSQGDSVGAVSPRRSSISGGTAQQPSTPRRRSAFGISTPSRGPGSPCTSPRTRRRTLVRHSIGEHDDETSRGDEVKVAVRVRPPLESGRPLAYFADEADQTRLLGAPLEVGAGSPTGKSFAMEELSFSRVIGPAENNQRTFDALGLKELIAGVVNGFQETIFAYGQTGSGKTHTILGSDGGEPGLLHLCTQELLRLVFDERNPSAGCENGKAEPRHYVQLMCLEIKNEDVLDLLPAQSTDGDLEEETQKAIREIISVKGKRNSYRKVAIWNFREALALLQGAIASREVGASAVNSESSRSHMVVRFIVKTLGESPSTAGAAAGEGVVGSLTLVDLAGNEKEAPPDSTHPFSENVAPSPVPGARKGETKAINVSLTHLNRMLVKMQNGELDESDRRQGSLNMVLYESLVEDCGVTMIFCIHPDSRYSTAARSTLQMALRCRNIVQQKRIRQIGTTGYQEEIDDLRVEASALTQAHTQALAARNRKENELKQTAEMLVDLKQRYEAKSNDNDALKVNLEAQYRRLSEEGQEKRQLVGDLTRKNTLLEGVIQELQKRESELCELQRRYEEACSGNSGGTSQQLGAGDPTNVEARVRELEQARMEDAQGFEDRCQELARNYDDKLAVMRENYERQLRGMLLKMKLKACGGASSDSLIKTGQTLQSSASAPSSDVGCFSDDLDIGSGSTREASTRAASGTATPAELGSITAPAGLTSPRGAVASSSAAPPLAKQALIEDVGACHRNLRQPLIEEPASANKIWQVATPQRSWLRSQPRNTSEDGRAHTPTSPRVPSPMVRSPMSVCFVAAAGYAVVDGGSRASLRGLAPVTTGSSASVCASPRAMSPPPLPFAAPKVSLRGSSGSPVMIRGGLQQTQLFTQPTQQMPITPTYPQYQPAQQLPQQYHTWTCHQQPPICKQQVMVVAPTRISLSPPRQHVHQGSGDLRPYMLSAASTPSMPSMPAFTRDNRGRRSAEALAPQASAPAGGTDYCKAEKALWQLTSTSDSTAVRSGLAQLSHLAVQAKLPLELRPRCLDAATAAMQRLPRSFEAQRDGAKLLADVLSKDPALKETTSARGAISIAVANLSTLAATVEAGQMTSGAVDIGVIAETCTACFSLLSVLCQNDKGRQVAVRVAGIVDATLRILASPSLRSGSGDTIVYGCWFLTAFCNKNGENQDHLRHCGCVPFLLHMLDTEVQTLAANSNQQSMDATRVVCFASATLCAYIVGCLTSLAAGSTDNQQAIYDGNGVQLLLRTLETCLQSPHVVSNASVAIAHIVHRHEQSQRATRSHGGIAIVLGALLAYRGHAAVQGGICRAIAVLAENNAANQKAFLQARLPDGVVGSEASAVTLLLQALANAKEDEALAVTSCWALANLVTSEPFALEQVRQRGGLETTVALLRCFAHEERPSEYLCRLLAELARGDAAPALRNRRELQEFGAVEVIGTVMKQHSNSHGCVLVHARDALKSIQDPRTN